MVALPKFKIALRNPIITRLNKLFEVIIHVLWFFLELLSCSS